MARTRQVVSLTPYGDRRLYDGARGAYLDAEEVLRRMRAGETIRIVEAGTGADVTQSAIQQIILEKARNG